MYSICSLFCKDSYFIIDFHVYHSPFFATAFIQVFDKSYISILQEVNVSLYADISSKALHLAKIIPRMKKLVPVLLENSANVFEIESQIPANIFPSSPMVEKLCTAVFAVGNQDEGNIFTSTLSSLLSTTA